MNGIIDRDIKFYIAMAKEDAAWLRCALDRRWLREKDEQRIRKRRDAALAIVAALLAYELTLNNSLGRDDAPAV
jgi:hypothetical protein